MFRHGRTGVGGYPGAAPSVDEEAALALHRLLRPVVEVLAYRQQDPARDMGGGHLGSGRDRVALLLTGAGAQQPVQGAQQLARGGGRQQPRRARDVVGAEQFLDAAVEGPGLLLTAGDGEHVGGVRPARVLVRVEALAEALERLAVGDNVGELGGGCGDRVKAGEQGTTDRPGQRTETGRLGEGHVAIRQGAGQAQDVGDGVQQQVRAAVEAGTVDDGAVLPDRDLLGLGTVGAVPGEHGEVAQAVLAQRCGTARQGQVQGGDLVVRGAARVQDRHAVADGGDQLVVRGEHFLVCVPVGAVRREGEEVNDTGPELVDGARPRGVVGERLADALHPELERVRHVGREVDEVDVVLDVVADHRAHGIQRARRGVEDDLFSQAREVLQQLPGELEAH